MNSDIPDRLRFPFKGFLWDGSRSSIMKNGRNFVDVKGPLCKECKVELSVDDFGSFGKCVICEKEYSFGSFNGASKLRTDALKFLEARYDQDIPILSFDLTPTKVIDGDNEDKNYWVQAKIIQKEGKRMAVVYIGEKVREVQNKTDYSQIFLDIDDEQVRFDKGNRNPMKLLARLEAEFQGSVVRINKEQSKRVHRIKSKCKK